jgi:hypothetical protein
MRKNKDPDPYLRLMDPDPYLRLMDPDPDPQHCRVGDSSSSSLSSYVVEVLDDYVSVYSPRNGRGVERGHGDASADHSQTGGPEQRSLQNSPHG